jgi:hypothetical protein
MDGRDEVKLATQMEMMQSTLDDLDVKVERLDEAIRGNGQTGLVTRMALVDTRLDGVEAFVGEFKSIRRGFALGVAALFGTLFWQVVEWYLGSQPQL